MPVVRCTRGLGCRVCLRLVRWEFRQVDWATICQVLACPVSLFS